MIRPTFEEVSKCKAEIEHIIGQINPQDLHKMFPGDTKVTEESILCSILGLGTDVTTRLEMVDPAFRTHQSDLQWLKEFVKLDEDECDVDESDDLHQVVDVLLKCGFTDSRAHMVATWIYDHPCRYHEPLQYWIESYLENMFLYDVLLNSVAKYPFNEKCLNKWFDVPIPTKYRGKHKIGGMPSSVNLAMYNTTHDEVKSIIKNKAKYPPQSVQEGYWYHGTSHTFAEHIIKNGVQIKKGRETRDFSDDEGFYLSNSLAYALQWCTSNKKSRRGPGAHGAVLVFKIEPDFFQRFKMYDLSEDKERWKNVLKYNRSGGNVAEFIKEEYADCDFLIGPLSIDGNKRAFPTDPRQVDQWEPTGWIKNDKSQICIQSNIMADHFGDLRKLDGVIFTWN
jgi:hypothetical protein